MNFQHKKLFIDSSVSANFDNLQNDVTFLLQQPQPMNYYNISNFTSFFKQFNILIPEVLVKTRSLLRLNGDNFFSVFTRYLSRHGNKNFSRKNILISFLNFIRSNNFNNLVF